MKKSVLFFTALLFAVLSSMAQNMAIQRMAGINSQPTLLGPLTGAAGPITGPATVCRLVTGVAYSIPLIPDATSYVWTVPPGAVIASGSGTNAITVNYPAGSQSGVMMVYGTGPTGPGAPSFLAITVLGPNVTGNTTPCKLATEVYTTEAGKTNYVWTFSGAQKLGGGGVTDNTITLKWIASGNRWVKVQYTDGTCTSNTTLPVTVQNSQPTLLGASASCVNGTDTYTTESGMVPGSYVWTISAGGSIVGGGGPNDATCSVKWLTSGAQTVTVNYASPLGCAISPTTFNVTVWDLPVPSLTGNAGPFCSGDPAQTYTTDAGKKDYIWTVSPGNNVISGGGLNDNTIQIQWLSSGPQTVSVNYTDKHGIYYLCTAASPTVLPVAVNPLPVPTITGSANICGIPSAGNVYTTEAGMTAYAWNVSAGGTIVGPTNTNSISVTWNAYGPQWVSVTYNDGVTGCAAASPTIANVIVNAVPTPTINGPTPVCVNSTGNTYQTEAGQFNYIWTVPTGGNITSGGGLNDDFVTVTWTAAGTHSVSVNYQNAQGCFAPASTNYNVTVTPDVGVPVFALGATSSRCQGAGSVTYTATATDNTSLSYSLDAVSLAAGNTINIATGEVTYVAAWTGISTITATATGCGPATQATHAATTTVQIQLSETHVDVLCNGGSTGSIDLTVTGGTGPFSFAWSNGATTEDISGLAAGSYTVNVTDANSCIESLTVTISEPAALALSETHVDVLCNGAATGSIDLTVTGGVGPYTYAWSNGATTEDISGLIAGVYTVTVTDANLCTATLPVTITEPPAIVLSETHLNVTCNGGLDGSIDLTVTNGVAPFTYSWSNGATTEDISGLAAGSYTVTVTDVNFCTGTLTVTITEPPAIVLSETHVDVLCNGASTGSIDLTVTNGVAPFTYSWSNGATTEDISGLAAGAYTVIVTDANLCTGTLTVTIAEPPAIVLTETHVNVLCNGGSTGSIDLTVTGGVAPYAYSWSNGATTQDISGLTAGDYTVTVTDANLCIATLTVTITEPPALVPVATSNSPICEGATLDLFGSATGGVPPYDYSWLGPNGFIAISTQNPSIPNATAAASGSYVLFVNDGNGCGEMTTTVVTVYPTPAVNPVANMSYCNGEATAVISFSGPVAGTTFDWVNDTPSIGLAASGSGDIPSFTATNTGLVPVIATITVTPTANGCVGIPTSFTITVNPTPTANQVPDDTYCHGEITIPISFIGPVAGTTFTWTNNDPSIGLPANGTGGIPSFIATNTGTLPVTATITVIPTANGCAGTPMTFTITVDPTPSVSPVSNVVYCNGDVTTAIVLSGPVAGTTFVWTNSDPSIGLAASGTGDIPSFTATNAGITPVIASITVTPSANGCTGTPITFTITVNPTPTVNPIANATYCNGATTAAIVITGPVAGTTFAWTNSDPSIGLAASGTGNILSFTATNTGTAPVIATITVTPAANGCTGTPLTFTITVNPTPTVNPVSDVTYCNGATTVVINFTGPVAGTTYTWTNDTPVIGLPGSGAGFIPSFTATNPGIAPLVATITVTPSANGCNGTPLTFTITVYPTPTANQVADVTYCNGETTLPVTFTGPVAGTTYDWTNTTPSIGLAASGTGDILSFTAMNAGNAPVVALITVTPTANGCTGIPMTFTITVNPTPTVNLVANVSYCNGATTAAITINGPVAGTTFAWTNDTPSIGLAASGNGSIPSFIATNAGTTTVVAIITITPTANGCTGPTTSFTITVFPTPSVNPVSSVTYCNGATTAAINFGGPVTGTTYSWTNNTPSIGLAASGTGDIPSFLATNTGSAPVVATITVTPSANGCTGTPITFTITVFPTPVVNPVANYIYCNNDNTMPVNFVGPVAGTTFAWTNNTPSIGLAASGTGNIPSFVATNSGTAPVVATITVTPSANGCTGPQMIFTITVNPTPTLTSTLTPPAICDNALFSYTPTSATAGTTFAWTRAVVAGIANAAASGTGNPNENLDNTTALPVPVTYVYTLTANGCTNPMTYNVVVVVNPTPVLTSTLNPPAICSGTAFAYTPTSDTPGTTFAWTRATVPGITPVGPTSGNGNPNEILVNTTPNPVNVTYIYTLTANGCTNPATYSVVVTVNPNPVLTSTLTPPAICSNTVFDYTPTSSTAGTTFAWSRAVVTGISNPAANGTDNPMETLINTTTNPVNVTYVYILAANGCTNPTTFNVVVTVNPLPVPTIAGYTSMCVNIGPLSYTTEAGMTGYFWEVSPGNTIQSGQGTNQIWINWTVPGNQWVKVTYVNTYGCSPLAPTQLDITVGPLPDAAGTITGTAAVCGGTMGVSYSVNPIANATSYVWTLPPGATIASGDGTNSITVDFDPFASSGDITVFGNNTCGNGTASPPFAVAVTPLPDTSSVITGDTELCQGVSGVTYTIDPIANAIDYVWTLPAGFEIVGGQNTNSIIVDVTVVAVSGTITVYGTNSCGSGQMGPALDVTVNPIPPAPVITQINNETLRSSATTGNLWYFEGAPAPPPNTEQDYYPTQAGEYWCVVVLNGCSSDTSNHILWPAVGIEPVGSSAQLTVYPVPNNGQFTVSISSPTEEVYSLKVYNNLGVMIHEIRSFEVNGTSERSIDLRPTPSGIYTVVLENSSKRVIRKIMINR